MYNASPQLNKSTIWGKVSPRKWRPVPKSWLGNVKITKREPQSAYLEITSDKMEHLDREVSEIFSFETSTGRNDLELEKPGKLRQKKSDKRVKPHRAFRRNDCYFQPGPAKGKKIFIKARNSGRIGNHSRRLLPQSSAVQFRPRSGPGHHYLTRGNMQGTNLGMSLAELLLQLQDREITAEDYDLLLQLDSANNSHPSEIRKRTAALSRWLSHQAGDELLNGGHMCVICMVPFQSEDRIKSLLCGHSFHSGCLNQWTRNSSPTCPLDNISIFEMRPEELGRTSEPRLPPLIIRLPEPNSKSFQGFEAKKQSERAWKLEILYSLILILLSVLIPTLILYWIPIRS